MSDLNYTRRKKIKNAKKALGANLLTRNGQGSGSFPDFSWLILRLQKRFKGADIRLRLFESGQQDKHIPEISKLSKFRQIVVIFLLSDYSSGLRFPVETEDDFGFTVPIDSATEEGRDEIFENCVEILSPIYEKATA